MAAAATPTYLDARPNLVTNPVDKHRLQSLIRDCLAEWKCAHKVEAARGDKRWAVLFSRFPRDGSVDLNVLHKVVVPNREFLRDVRVDWGAQGAAVVVRVEIARSLEIADGDEDALDDADWEVKSYRESEFGELLDERIDERSMGSTWPRTRERLVALDHAIKNQEQFMPLRPSAFVHYPNRGTAALDTENMSQVTYAFLRYLTGLAHVLGFTAKADGTLRVHFDPRTANPSPWMRIGGRVANRKRGAGENETEEAQNKRARA